MCTAGSLPVVVLDAGQVLVDVHRVQQRLVIAGLELVGADEEAVRIFRDLLGDPAGREAVQRRLGDLPTAERALVAADFDED